MAPVHKPVSFTHHLFNNSPVHGISQPQGAGGSGPSGWVRALGRPRTANTLNFPANVNGFGYLHLCGECLRNQEKLENNTRAVKAVKNTTWCFRKERKMFFQHNSSSPGLAGLRDLDIFTQVAPRCFGEVCEPGEVRQGTHSDERQAGRSRPIAGSSGPSSSSSSGLQEPRAAPRAAPCPLHAARALLQVGELH